MSKNMTRKGLAFGAIFALVSTGMASVPANAAGLADKTYVSLLPLTGTEYTVLHDQYFDLKASFADSLAGVSTRDLKFLINDASLGEDFRYDVDINGSTADVNSNIITGSVDGGSGVLTVNSTGHGLQTGDTIFVDSALTITVAGTSVTAGTAVVVTRTDADNFTFPNTNATTSSEISIGGSTASASAVAGFTARLSAVGVSTGNIDIASNVATVTVASTARLNSGETVTISGVTGNTGGGLLTSAQETALNASHVITVVNSTTFTFPTPTITTAANVALTSGKATIDDPTSDTALSSRSLLLATNLGNDRLTGTATALSVNDIDEYYVVDTTLYSVGDQAVLRVVNTGDDNASVEVTAWMDSNGNNKIDDTEYTSPTRTVNFHKASKLTVATTMAPIIGDASLTARVTTTPVLNGQQVVAQDVDWLNVRFTRQGSTAALYGANDGTSSATSAWNDVTKTWTVDVTLAVPQSTPGTNSTTSTAVSGTPAGEWLGLLAPANPDSSTLAISTAGVVTVTTNGNHNLTTGDKITMVSTTAGLELAAESSARTITVTSPTTFTYRVSETTGLPTTAVAATSASTTSEYTVATYSSAPAYLTGRVFAGTYTAQAYVLTAAQGNLVTATTAAATSSTLEIASTASASVQGKAFTAAASNVAYVKTGTLSVPLTISVTDASDVAVTAGRPIVVTLAASGATETFKVNGKSTTDTVYTDASGKATVTITSATGKKDSVVQVTAVAEGVATADIDLTWADQAYNLVDLAVTDSNYTDAGGSGDIVRTILEKGSYEFNFGVMDQWFQPAAADTYRLKVLGEGVTPGLITLTNGRGTVKVTDSGVEGTDLQTDVVLQKQTSGVWADVSTYDVTTNLVKGATVQIGANGTTLYSATAVDTSADVAEKALVELDKRTSTTAVPAYGTGKFVRLSGQVINSTTSAGLEGAVVTISGPSNLLFVDTATSNVYKRGSLTFASNAASGANAGKWEVLVYSTTAQTDTVVTVTANGASSTTKISFTGTGVGEGTSLVVTSPAAVKPASTFQVKAKLTDVYGNAVDTAAGRVKVTYTGAGIVFGTLPDQTDANGELMFSVLLGSNDTGNITVTVSYDQNADTDFVDAKDLNTTKTIAITASGTLTTGKVNVGSFNGKLVVYASGLNGARISWKVGGVWGVGTATSNYSIFNRPTPRAGVTVSVDVYVNGVKTLTKSVVTR